MFIALSAGYGRTDTFADSGTISVDSPVLIYQVCRRPNGYSGRSHNPGQTQAIGYTSFQTPYQ